jgi:hypothetical protein
MIGYKCVLGGIILVVAALASAGCDGSRPPPTAPTDVVQARPPAPVQPAPVQDVVFREEESFSAWDVYDVNDEVIRFNTAHELIWIADGARFQGFVANGNEIKGPGDDDWFQVHFGTRHGVRRAYLGWSLDACHCPGAIPTIIDVEVVGDRVVFKGTDVPVPGSVQHLDAPGAAGGS